MKPDFDTTGLSTQVIEHLLRISGLRRRDELLSGLTQALSETTANHRVATFSLVHEGNHRYWLPMTQAEFGQPVRLVCDPLRTDFDTLAPIDSEPDRLCCINRMAVIATAPTPSLPLHITRFPITLSEEATLWGVAEIASDSALDSVGILTAQRLIALYANMLDMLDYSECDALTGLWNRKPFDEHGPQQRSHRTNIANPTQCPRRLSLGFIVAQTEQLDQQWNRRFVPRTTERLHRRRHKQLVRFLAANPPFLERTHQQTPHFRGQRLVL